MGLLSTIGGLAGSYFGPVGRIAGAAIGGAIEGKGSAKKASGIQSNAAQAGIDEERRQFDKVTELLSPFVQAGTSSLSQQQNILGLGGADAQRSAFQGFEQSPAFQSLVQQGESGILQNASATGGLRGGNIQAALSQFRPQLLNQFIGQQFDRLGGLTSLGQNAAAGVGNAGLQTGSNISNLLQQQGAAQAGGVLAQNNATSIAPGIFGLIQGSGGFGGSNFGSSLQSGFSQTSLGGSGFGSGLAFGNQDLGSFL